MCDVLAIIGQLSKTFQMVDIELSLIELAVHFALTKLEQLKTQPGEKTATVLSDLADNKMTYRNVPLKDNSDFTKQDVRHILDKFFDGLCDKLKNRFPQDETFVMRALDKILNPKRMPIRAACLKLHGEKYLKVASDHFGHKQTATDEYAFVCYNDIVHEWNDCSLLMHADRIIGLADFCKTLITLSQYMQDYPNLAKLTYVVLIIPVKC